MTDKPTKKSVNLNGTRVRLAPLNGVWNGIVCHDLADYIGVSYFTIRRLYQAALGENADLPRSDQPLKVRGTRGTRVARFACLDLAGLRAIYAYCADTERGGAYRNRVHRRKALLDGLGATIDSLRALEPRRAPSPPPETATATEASAASEVVSALAAELATRLRVETALSDADLARIRAVVREEVAAAVRQRAGAVLGFIDKHNARPTVDGEPRSGVPGTL